MAAIGLSIAPFLGTSCSNPAVAETSHLESSLLFDLLDTGLSPFEAFDALFVIAEVGDLTRDTGLSPFEALDALLVIAEDGDLTRDTIKDFLDEYAEDDLAESRDFFDMGDSDRDGKLALDELPDGFTSMMSSLDADGDGAISWSEFQLADIATSELMARGEGAEFYADLVEDIGEPVRLEGAPLDFVEELRSLDLNGDGIVTQQETVQMIRDELAGATFEVVGELAIMRGLIVSGTPSSVLELAFMNPEVRTLVLVDMPGSIDDVAMVRAGRYIRQIGLDTHVPADSEVASGATDLFLAGVHRSAEPGARFGIHSWGGGPVPATDLPPVLATDLPRDHEDHLKYLDYYAEMGIPGEFYWRTLSAAPAEGIHWMTEDELERFGFFTDGKSGPE